MAMSEKPADESWESQGGSEPPPEERTGPHAGEEHPADAELEEGEEEELWVDMPEVEIHVSRDKMQILLDYPAIPNDLDEFIETLRRTLLERGVDTRLLGQELDARLRAVPEEGAEGFHQVVLVEGRPPDPPVDGYIDWAGDFFTEGFHVDEETGAIDYRRHVAQSSVEVDQLLATIIPPKPGKSGYNVFGREVPSRKGSYPVLKVGQNVREGETEATYYSTTSGRIRWVNDTLFVDEVFTIEGNVGLETGHVSHPGALVVEGDIEAGAKVEARGDIEVHGIVEKADVSTGGNLMVRGGVMGVGENPLQVAGKVQAKFIIDAQVEAGGDVIVEREILQSRIKTRGAVAMQKGRCVGGSVMALGGVLVGQTGSEAVVPTMVIAGVDFKLQEKVKQIQKEIDALEKRREQIKTTLKPIASRLAKLNDEQKATVKKLLNEVTESDKAIEEKRQEITELREQSKELSRPRIEVSRAVCPETFFCIGADRLHIRDSYVGPVHALRVRDGIQIRPGSLNWSAKYKPEEDEADHAPDGEDEAEPPPANE